MSRIPTIVKRTLLSFYDDQMTQHAAALTYYGLMSLFPAALLGLSLLGLIGQYPETYNAIIDYLEDVAPASVVAPLDRSLRTALQNKGTATTALVISVVLAFYGTTGVLEAARRALNVVFEVTLGAQLPPAQDRGHRLHDRPRDPRSVQPDHGLRGRPLRRRPVRLRRSRLHGRQDLEPHPLARGRGRRDARVRLRLLRDPGREAALVPLAHPRCRRGRADLAAGVLRPLDLRVADRGRGRGLRHLHRGDRAGALAVADLRGVAVRGGAERRDRAREAAHRRGSACPDPRPSRR